MPQTLPRLSICVRRWSLRQRILLLFAGLAGALLLVMVLAFYFALVKHGNAWAIDALLTAVVVSVCGSFGLIFVLWRLFDENVAKPIERLAGELRTRSHTDFTAELEDLEAHHLGDLAPAASALIRNLNMARNELAETVARETTKQVLEKERVLSLLAHLPLGVLVCTMDHRLVLYNAQAQSLLSAAIPNSGGKPTGSSSHCPTPLCLGRSVFDYLDPQYVLPAFEAMREAAITGAKEPITFTLPFLGKDLDCTIRPLELPASTVGLSAEGYVLFLPDTGPAAAAIVDAVYDFELLTVSQYDSLTRQPSQALTYVVFDTETTGLLPDRGDEIVQLAAVRVVNGRRIPGEVLNTLVNPGRPIPPSSTRIHGITDAMVKDAPSPAEVARQFHAFAKGAVLVAHNADFDMAFLRRAAPDLHFDQPVMDTCVLSAMVFGAAGNHSLDALAERLNVELSDEARHTALGDAVATADILLKLLAALQARQLPDG